MVNSNNIEEIKKLNKEVKQLIKENKIIILDEFYDDMIKHQIKKEIIDKALVEGLHLEDCHLYPANVDEKHEGKNYYCVYKYKEIPFHLIEIKYILISYLKKISHITLFHTSFINYGSREQRRYEELNKKL